MKNKKTKLMLILMLALSSSLLFAQFEGNGTESEPYRIYTKQDLETLSELIKTDSLDDEGNNVTWSYGRYFTLMNNITEPLENPIGDTGNGNSAYRFRGNFNGRNYKITLAMNVLTGLTSLFPNIGDAKISNLIVDGSIMSNPNGNGGHIGCIVGIAINSTIENCINMCNVYFYRNTAVAAGICYAAVGDNSPTQIINCINMGNIVVYTGTVDYACGITAGIFNYGNSTPVYISNCANYGDIILLNNGISSFASGITCFRHGYTNYGSNIIENCVNYGLLSAPNCAGISLFGANATNSTTIRNCVNVGIIMCPEPSNCYPIAGGE